MAAEYGDYAFCSNECFARFVRSREMAHLAEVLIRDAMQYWTQHRNAINPRHAAPEADMSIAVNQDHTETQQRTRRHRPNPAENRSTPPAARQDFVMG